MAWNGSISRLAFMVEIKKLEEESARCVRLFGEDGPSWRDEAAWLNASHRFQWRRQRIEDMINQAYEEALKMERECTSG